MSTSATIDRRLRNTALLVAAAVLLAAAAVHLMRADHPLLNLRTLEVATFRAAVGSGSLFWASVTGVPFLLTLLLQNVFGWSPVKSGAIVLFVFVGNIAIKPATTPLLRRFGFRPVLVVATAGAAATMVLAGLFTAATPLVIIALVSVLNGVGRSVGLTGYSTIVFSDTPPSRSVTPIPCRRPRSNGRWVWACRWPLSRSAPAGRWAACSAATRDPGTPTRSRSY